jgi:hypothetical protein
MRLNEIADPEIYRLSDRDTSGLLKQIERASRVHMPDGGGHSSTLDQAGTQRKTKAPQRLMSVSQRRPLRRSS